MTDGDPTVTQAWLIAIPSAITAFSTWYLNRKSNKTHQETRQVASDAVDSSTTAITAEIQVLKDRVAKLEDTVTKSRDCQLILAQRYTDNMNSLQIDLVAAKSVLERVIRSASLGRPSAVSQTSQEAESPGSSVEGAPDSSIGTVKVIDTPQPKVGKVTWEK